MDSLNVRGPFQLRALFWMKYWNRFRWQQKWRNSQIPPKNRLNRHGPSFSSPVLPTYLLWVSAEQPNDEPRRFPQPAGQRASQFREPAQCRRVTNSSRAQPLRCPFFYSKIARVSLFIVLATRKWKLLCSCWAINYFLQHRVAEW